MALVAGESGGRERWHWWLERVMAVDGGIGGWREWWP